MCENPHGPGTGWVLKNVSPHSRQPCLTPREVARPHHGPITGRPRPASALSTHFLMSGRRSSRTTPSACPPHSPAGAGTGMVGMAEGLCSSCPVLEVVAGEGWARSCILCQLPPSHQLLVPQGWGYLGLCSSRLNQQLQAQTSIKTGGPPVRWTRWQGHQTQGCDPSLRLSS